MNVTCNKCHKLFELKIKERTKIIDGVNIRRTFLSCPFCGEQCTISYSNSEMSVLQKQIDRIYRRINGSNMSDEELKKWVWKINNKKERIKQINARLHLLYDEQFRMEG